MFIYIFRVKKLNEWILSQKHQIDVGNYKLYDKKYFYPFQIYTTCIHLQFK